MLKSNPEKVLRAAAALAVCIGLFASFVVVPWMAANVWHAYPTLKKFVLPTMLYVWIFAAICFVVLWQFWKICREIARDNSFSRENERALCAISRLMLAGGGWLAAGIPVALAVGARHPGLFLRLILGALCCALVAMLASALSHLVGRAYQLKLENDLTI